MGLGRSGGISKRSTNAPEAAAEAAPEAAEAEAVAERAWRCILTVFGDAKFNGLGNNIVRVKMDWERMAWPQMVNEDKVETYCGVPDSGAQ